MAERLTPFRRSPHIETQRLLPWYATGRLDAADRGLVDTHLATCRACREELAAERRLSEDVSKLAPEIDRGWMRLRERINGSTSPPPPARHEVALAPAQARWSLMAPFAAAAAALMLVVFLERMPAPFHVLGAASSRPVGDAMIVFRPEARESDMRRALELTGARIVYGPTAAGAYVLRTPAGQATRALATLRAQAAVEAVQPIDLGP